MILQNFVATSTDFKNLVAGLSNRTDVNVQASSDDGRTVLFRLAGVSTLAIDSATDGHSVVNGRVFPSVQYCAEVSLNCSHVSVLHEAIEANGVAKFHDADMIRMYSNDLHMLTGIIHRIEEIDAVAAYEIEIVYPYELA